MNYGQLKAYVAAFTHRDDLGAQMDNFFDLAHNDILVSVDWQSMEKYEDLQMVANISSNIYSFDLPIDAVRLRSVTSGKRDISYLHPSVLKTRFANNGGGQSFNYTVVGRQIWTAPGSADIQIVYQQAEPPMTADSDENEIARLYPNLYIYGAASQLHAFVQDDEEEGKARQRFGQELSNANMLAERLRFGVAPAVQGV